MDDEFDRYSSSDGWEPPDPYKKQRERLRSKAAMEPDPADSMLEIRPAGEWITDGSKHRVRSSELFGSLWRESEVAVLFGDKGSGKSVLAVQIAEAIARGRNTTGRECASSQSAIRIPHSENESENFPLSTVHFPFLGLTYLGPSTESEHLRDHAAEALRDEIHERKRLQAISKLAARHLKPLTT